MNHMACDDRDALIAFLYGEDDEVARAGTTAHLADCLHCREELESLRGVRDALACWAPPERVAGFGASHGLAQAPAREGAASVPWWTVWRVPIAAAASILVLAGAAGLAHIEVRYNADGLVVRTGWATASPTTRRAETSVPAAASDAHAAPWQPDLTAFEARIDQRLNALTAAQPAGTKAAALPSQAGLLQQVQGLVQASEQRQQRQFALRLTDAMRDVEAQRRADLVRIDQGFGQIEGTTGVAVAQQRELWNYLVRVAQHPQ
ncbi:MAG TPA: hypothetical protein VIC33_12635 [Vicinamibacterales bacterium]|jgi:hypothetical protein